MSQSARIVFDYLYLRVAGSPVESLFRYCRSVAPKAEVCRGLFHLRVLLFTMDRLGAVMLRDNWVRLSASKWLEMTQARAGAST